MGAVGIPLLGLLGTTVAAGGAAYVTKKVIDGANNRAIEKANNVQPDIQSAISQSAREKALLDQQNELARQKIGQSSLATNNRRRSLLAPGVVTSNLGITGNPNTSGSLLGN